MFGIEEGWKNFYWIFIMLAMAEVNISRIEKMLITVLCVRERIMLRDRRCSVLGKSCR